MWQHLPETIDPIAFTIGFFSVYWYAVWFLAGFFIVLWLAFWLARRGNAPCPPEDIFDLFAILFFGAFLGGRIGYVFFYNHLGDFFQAPLSIFLPYDFTHNVWTGISGMSYHGGLIGVAVALAWFTGRGKLSFWKTADFVALLAPVVIFFGRLGNFFNVELPGRITTAPWGMVFPGTSPAGALRHPSTLYEALFEGVVLFIVLLFLRRLARFDGALACFYLALYAIARFGSEYFREPDPQLGLFFGLFTMGQMLSFAMLGVAAVIYIWLRRRNRAKIANNG
ncbi:MAG: prolipoprotein diacylglyceryl transferase [bacterium]|nr:prolipoprotein diacylglyceryl transferase [bacterium]